ncbi:MAG: hypothetical protein ACI9KE_000647 [Polyangiales bacterium]
MLLRFIGLHNRGAPFDEGVSVGARRELEESGEGVQARAGEAPFILGGPFKLTTDRVGHSPAVCEAELGEHRSRSGEPKVLDEVLTQHPHRHRVDEQSALSSEENDVAFRIQLQQFLSI